MLKYLLACGFAYLIAITVSVIYQVEKYQQGRHGIVIISRPSPMAGNTENPIWLQPSFSLTATRRKLMWLRNPV